MPDSQSNSKLKAWLWVLGGLVVALAIALVVVLVARDGSDSKQADSTSTSTSSTSSTTTSTTPTTTPTTTTPPTTTTIPYPVITTDPQTYAQYLFVAWQNADQGKATTVANAEAVQQMFSQAYSASAGWQAAGCGPAAGSLYCTWNASNGNQLVIQVRTLTGGLPVQVTGVTRS